MSKTLFEARQTDKDARLYLESVGQIFATFDALTQDSGNVSYGVRIDSDQFFVKTTDPMASVFLSYEDRVKLLHNAIDVGSRCAHPSLPALRNVITSASGPMLVYDWVEGELLGGNRREESDSAHKRFRALPVSEILRALDSIYELHFSLAAKDLVAVDLYDGCLIYDFSRREIHMVDLDGYHRGPFVNVMGRMFGSTRFMAPEEFRLGAVIDQRTTVYTLGRMAAVFLSDNSLDRDPFRGDDEHFAVVCRACHLQPDERYQSIEAFHAAWQAARSRG